MNTRPGAMALNQSKIEMFNDYNNKYLKKINEKLHYFLESSDGLTNPPSNFS